VDFKREKLEIPRGLRPSSMTQPFRQHRPPPLSDGEKRYILAPIDLKVGDTCWPGAGGYPAGKTPFPEEHSAGTQIHNLEVKKEKAGSWFGAPVPPDSSWPKRGATRMSKCPPEKSA